MDHAHHHDAVADDHAHHHDHRADHVMTENMATTGAPLTTDGGFVDHSAHHGHSDPSTQNSVGGVAHNHQHGMAMTFHGGYAETVLFEWWNINTLGGLMASIVGIFLIAVLYEGLKYYREYLFWRTCNGLQYRAVQPPEEKASPSDEPAVVQPSMWSKFHLWQTFLHAIQVSVSYLLMLIFMTYNSWLCLAVVAGAACGNFLFGWKKSVVVDVTEHCH